MAGPDDESPGATEWAVPGQVGVGPWPGDAADWPADGHYDPELLAHGDTRNVVDAYRYWRRAAVADDLPPARTRSTSPSRTSGTTTTSAPWCARPTRSARRACTSWAAAGGTAGVRW